MTRHTLADWIHHHASRIPDDLVFLWRDRRLDWSHVDRRVRRLASGLRARGIGAGDIVAARLANRPEWLYLFGACSAIGAAFAPLQMRLGPSELESLLEHLEPTCFVESSAATPSLDAIDVSDPSMYLELPSDYAPDLEGLAADALLESSAFAPISPDAPALLLHTTGTTGAPKIVPHTWTTLLWNHRQFIDELNLTSQELNYCVAPLAHAAGANVLTGPLLYRGGTTRLVENFDPERVGRDLAAGDVTCTFMVPAMWRRCLEALGTPVDSEAFRFGVVGGAPVSSELVARARSNGLHLVEGYGMTEAGPMVSLLDADDPTRHDRSVGWPGMHVDVQIIDDQGEPCDEDERGEVWVRGANLVDRYWRQEEATRQSFREDGWLQTGDLGAPRGDGTFDVIGRLDDMIISGGKNIHPRDVEDCLRRLDSIRAVGVVGTPHPTWSEIVTAAVVPADEAEGPTLDEMRAAVCDRLARYKAPRRLALVESLPENPTGKLARDRLRSRLENDDISLRTCSA